jgi:hypothetical protein
MKISGCESKSMISNFFNSSLALLLIPIFVIFLAIAPSIPAYAVQTFTKDEMPFGIPYEVWFKDYWNWWINHSQDEINKAKEGGCLMNASSSIVMVLENAHGKFADQNCNVNASQGIMLPLWIGWCDSSESPPVAKEKLADCALARYNIGDIRSEVKVDGKSVANLHAIVDGIPGDPNFGVNYKPILLNNVTEVHTKPFILKWPGPDKTFKPGADHAGNLNAGAQGWLTFLKALPRGDHTVSYNVVVECTKSINSPDCIPVPPTENTYHFHVQ